MRKKRHLRTSFPRIICLASIFLAVYWHYLDITHIQPSVERKAQAAMANLFESGLYSYRSIGFHPLKGVEIQDFYLYESSGSGTKDLLLYTPSFRIDFSLKSFLLEKALDAKMITIESFVIILRRQANGEIGLPEKVIERIMRYRERSVIRRIETLRFKKGKGLLGDTSNITLYKKILSDVYIDLKMGTHAPSFPSAFHSSFIIDSPKPASCILTGEIALSGPDNMLTTGHIKTSPFNAGIINILFPGLFPAKELSGEISIDSSYSLTGPGILSIDGQFTYTDFSWISLGSSMSGSLYADVLAEYDLLKGFFNHRNISLSINDGTFREPLSSSFLTECHVSALIQQNDIIIEKLSGKINGLTFTAEGLLENFEKNPFLSLKISQKSDLSSFFGQIPSLKSSPLALLGPTGKTHLTASLQADLNNLKGLEVNATLVISDGSLTLPGTMKKITDINGSALLSRDKIALKDVSFTLDGNAGTINGTYHLPAGHFSAHVQASSYDITLKGEHLPGEEKLVIHHLTGRYLDSTLKATGRLDQFSNPVLMLTGESALDMRNVYNIFGFAKNRFSSLEGVIDLRGNVTVSLKDLDLLEATFTLRSQKLTLGPWSFSEITTRGLIDPNRIILSDISANLFAGKYLANFEGLRYNQNVSYTLTGSLEKMDLYRAISAISDNDPKVFGDFDGAFEISGILSSLKSMTGQVQIAIRDGNLGPLPFVNPVLSPLETILYGLRDDHLQEAYGDLTIKEKKVYTDNLKFWGDKATLLFKGHIDFSGNLDFQVENSVSEGLLDKGAGLNKFVGNILDKTRKYFGKTRIKGNVANPIYRYELLPSSQQSRDGSSTNMF